MNRADRRRNGSKTKPQLLQVGGETPAANVPPPPIFGVRPAGSVEQVATDGTKVRMMVFHVFTADGVQLVEKTATGDQPVVIASMPIVVGKSVILSAGLGARG